MLYTQKPNYNSIFRRQIPLMRYLYMLLLFLLFQQSFGQGMWVEGVITDMDSKQPVADASVIITFFAGGEYATVTDSLGRYVITTKVVVPDGDFPLQILHPVYYPSNGFVHVTKNCKRDFTIKKKIPKIEPADTIIAILPPKPVLEGYATNNLVFLIDVSASMNAPEKMPLIKESLKYLVNELRPTDKIAIMTFSNQTKEILPSTSAQQKELILQTIDGLAFGSTSQGGAALTAAYKNVEQNFIQKGNNRVVLISDGLFTSGEKDFKKMQQTITAGAAKNLSLSIFCFGKTTGYVDEKLRKLSVSGKGNYAVIQNAESAKVHFIEEAKALKAE